jgi:antitoxin component of MazEF toxin-antitoxin module
MKKHLMQIGNSLALVIDKPVLELLHIDKETELELSTNGEQLLLSPVRESAVTPEFRKHAEEVFKQYHETFKRLADYDRGQR